jgi:hypothetical protein
MMRRINDNHERLLLRLRDRQPDVRSVLDWDCLHFAARWNDVARQQGWDHAQQVMALLSIICARTAEGDENLMLHVVAIGELMTPPDLGA